MQGDWGRLGDAEILTGSTDFTLSNNIYGVVNFVQTLPGRIDIKMSNPRESCRGIISIKSQLLPHLRTIACITERAGSKHPCRLRGQLGTASTFLECDLVVCMYEA